MLPPDRSDSDVERQCAAPSTSMEFDQYGDVTACCANVLFPLGNVRFSTLEEIWRGRSAADLRAAVNSGDLTLGCSICRHRIDLGHPNVPSADYEHLAPSTSVDASWPKRLAFSLHNRCNLACVMCGPDRSSRIRDRTAGLHPLEPAYGPDFFEQLVPFVSRCSEVSFQGGEPFLVPAHHEVFGLLKRLNPSAVVQIVTNGTIWNAGVARLLAQFECHVLVSIDGMSARTFESIRLGAKKDVVSRNLDRIRGAIGPSGSVGISWCLMRHNWFEFAEAVDFAAENGLGLVVQTVIEPDHGLTTLPTDELKLVIDSLQLQGDRSVWPERYRLTFNEQVRALQLEVARREERRTDPLCMSFPSPSNHVLVEQFVRDTPVTQLGPTDRAQVAEQQLLRWARHDGRRGHLEFDSAGTLVAHDLTSMPDVLVPAIEEVSLRSWSIAIASHLRRELWVVEQYRVPTCSVQTLAFGGQLRDKDALLLRLVAFNSETGYHIHLGLDRSVADRGRWTSVAISARPGSQHSRPSPVDIHRQHQR